MTHEPRIEDDAEILLVEDAGDGVRILTLNRPESYNALSLDLISAITAEIASAADDAAVRVLVIRGAGRGFCAGHDLDEVMALEVDDDRRTLLQACSTMMQAVVRGPVPVIAEIHGSATAAGCQLAASADLAFAADDARFATPGVNIGLFCSTPMVALGRAVGPKHALKMLLTGEPISAQTAVEIGLINEAIPIGELHERVLETARMIASKSTHVVGLGKRAFRHQDEMPLAEAYDFCTEVVIDNLKAEDAAEGIDAFLEKRKPVWRDR